VPSARRLGPGPGPLPLPGKDRRQGPQDAGSHPRARRTQEDATDSLRECIALFEQGLEKYYARDWDGAIALFRKSEPLEPNGVGRARGSSNNPSLVYIGIAEGYREEPPPPDWDGVFEMKEK
jgi:hypothetical protein